MKKFEFFDASRATRQRHFKTSSTGDENGSPFEEATSTHARSYVCLYREPSRNSNYLGLITTITIVPVSHQICFSVDPSSNPRSRFVNSQLVYLLPVGIFNYVTFIILKYLFPLFQKHACKLAKLSACIAKCMATWGPAKSVR